MEQKKQLEFASKNVGKKEFIKAFGEEPFQDFCSIGFINSNGLITEHGKHFYHNIYGKPTFYEKILGYFCHYILRITQ